MQWYRQSRTAEWRTADLKAGVLLLVVLTALALFASPARACAWDGAPAFPRIAIWWPSSDEQPLAQRARCDWTVLPSHDGDHIAELRAANPAIIVLGTTNARELYYDLGNHDAAFNVEMRSASPDWILTQVGSTLASGVDRTTTTIPVRDVTNFRAGEMVLVDGELLYVDKVGSSTLTVRARGIVYPQADHAAGARIAPVVSSWTGSVTMDLSVDCPRRDVGEGPETWADWNLRRARRIMGSADWDGLLVDCLEGNPRWMVAVGLARSFDPDRTNTAVTDDYEAFNAAWNTGAEGYADALRAAFEDRIIIGNGNLRNFSHNGTVFEAFPREGMSLDYWDMIFTGTCVFPWASYPEWSESAAAPNLTLIQTYGKSDDYRLMRFGLCSTLLRDGYYTYALSGEGHARNGIWWYDEYDNAGAGRGYLGRPTGAPVKAGSAWRRDFDEGIALVNPTAKAVTVKLGTAFRKIKGRQDPAVNDGKTVTSVTVPGHDGIILLRIPEVRLSASASTVQYGGSTVLSVAVTPGANAAVRLEKRRAGASLWSVAASRTLDASGAAQIGRSPAVTTEYRVVLVGAGVVSKTVRVGVSPLTSLRASRSAVRRGGAVVLSGAVSPRGRFRMSLQRRVGGSWKTVKRLTTGSTGRYSTAVSPGTAGTRTYRVRVDASSYRVAAVSGAVSLVVR